MTLSRWISHASVAPALLVVFAACAGEQKAQPKNPELTSAEQEPAANATDTSGKESRSMPNTMKPEYQPNPPGDRTSQPVPAPSMQDQMQGGSSAMPATTPGKTSSADMTDDQVLQAVHVANIAEVDQAKLALAKSKNERVKQFANMMVRDHSEADSMGYNLAHRLNISLADSTLSNQLQSNTQQTLVQLRGEGSTTFDRGYIDAQISEHKDVLDTLDNTLLPNAKNPDVRTHLQSIRAKVAAHLKEAQSIQGSLR